MQKTISQYESPLEDFILATPKLRGKELGRVTAGLAVHDGIVLGDKIDAILEICPLKLSNNALQSPFFSLSLGMVNIK